MLFLDYGLEQKQSGVSTFLIQSGRLYQSLTGYVAITMCHIVNSHMCKSGQPKVSMKK